MTADGDTRRERTSARRRARPRARAPRALVAVALALLLVAGGSFAWQRIGTSSGPDDVPRRAAEAAPPGSATSTAATIAALQTRLRTLPADHDAWARLGAAYVEQARAGADPAYYPKAEGALKRSLALRGRDNPTAFAASGALANARHEFRAGLEWGRKAQVAAPHSAVPYGVIDDALTQLGDYRGAGAAVRQMLQLQPGVASFTRASYDFEEQGRTDQAREALERALAVATTAADIGFCRLSLGELAANTGRPQVALAHFEAGLRADRTSAALLAGRARAEAALGRRSDAVRDYAAAVGRAPLPQYLLEYGELLLALGRDREAAAQFEVLRAELELLAAGGVVEDLTAAVFEADHGSPEKAVAHARAEWARRKSVLVADALGWALHRAGRDAEAITYARQANRLGWRSAVFRHHLGMIEAELGMTGPARTHLTEALAFDPHFSVLQAPEARSVLARLDRG